jgi:hypothetical protein
MALFTVNNDSLKALHQDPERWIARYGKFQSMISKSPLTSTSWPQFDRVDFFRLQASRRYSG